MPKEKLNHDTFDQRVLAAMKPAKQVGNTNLLQQLKAKAQQMQAGRQPIRQLPRGR